MKHTKKTALTAAVLAAAMGLSACEGGSEVVETVYGPPSAYVPETEEIQDVYGPPPVVSEETEPVETTTVIEVLPEESATTATAEAPEGDNDMQFVYGPPNAIDE